MIIIVAISFSSTSCKSYNQTDQNAEISSDTNVVISDEKQPVATPLNTQIAEDNMEVEVSYNDYNISIEVDPDNRKVVGIQDVSFKNRTNTAIDNIYFNLYLNGFSKNVKHNPYFQEFEKKIFGQERKNEFGYIDIIDVTVNGEDASFNVNETVLSINLAQKLAPEESVEITLQFDSYIPKINHRIGANDKAMWFGNFLPILAVYDKTGWHTDPYYKAGNPFYSNISNYTVKITTPMGYKVIGTGEESFVETEDSRQTTISAKMVRDFAFVVSDSYELQTVQTNSGIYVNVYSYSDLECIDELLVLSIKGLDFFGDLLGTYPYISLDIVETGYFMESAMGSSEIIFVDSSLLKSGGFDETLIHEIGRQWFYNVIGSNQVKESWLSEGLVSQLQMWLLYDEDEIAEIMQQDYDALNEKLKTMEVKTLSQDLSVFNSWEEYYNIENTRAKLMMYSLFHKMGPSVSEEFIKTYFERYAFKIATKKDFVALAEEFYRLSLESFFDEWLNNYDLPELNN